MIKTFEELLNDIPKEDRINNGSKETVINLLKKVREATIKECIKKGYGYIMKIFLIKIQLLLIYMKIQYKI